MPGPTRSKPAAELTRPADKFATKWDGSEMMAGLESNLPRLEARATSVQVKPHKQEN